MGGALVSGISLEVGMISDSKGDKAVYFSFGGNLGFGGGYALKGGVIVPNGNHSFLVDDFSGKGNSWSIGIGPLGYEKGGTQGNGFSDYGNRT